MLTLGGCVDICNESGERLARVRSGFVLRSRHRVYRQNKLNFKVRKPLSFLGNRMLIQSTGKQNYVYKTSKSSPGYQIFRDKNLVAKVRKPSWYWMDGFTAFVIPQDPVSALAICIAIERISKPRTSNDGDGDWSLCDLFD